jgi:hypothetical protein
MKNAFLFSLLLSLGTASQAQNDSTRPGTIRNYTGKEVDYAVKLDEALVKDTRAFSNDTARYRFNQTKYYVTTIWPYVQEAVALVNEVDYKLNVENLSGKKRRNYINDKEAEVKAKVDDKVKSLNTTQGALLIKLINRQTGKNCFNILREFKNPVSATMWQGWAKVHGFNLNEDYDPDKEVLLESVMRSLGH